MDENKKRDFTIGIGVTTTPNRKDCLDMCLNQIRKHTKHPYHLHVHDDVNYRGVAYSKNQNLRALKDCDFVFLFDDDCWPIHDGWVNLFINSSHKHLLFLVKEHKPFIHCGDHSTVYSDCGGVFMYITKECVEKVGAFDEDFSPWGFEHADYSKRIALATGENYVYRSLDNTSEYLYARDYNGEYHLSSVSDDNKLRCFKKNFKKFLSPIPNIYIPL